MDLLHMSFLQMDLLHMNFPQMNLPHMNLSHTTNYETTWRDNR
jgi:hypothetical protein